MRDILEALCRYGPLSFTEIMRVTGYSKGSVSAKLRALVEEGAVSRTGRYYYASYAACRRQGEGLVLVIKTGGREYTVTLPDFIATLRAVMKMASPPGRGGVDEEISQVWRDINTIIAFVKERRVALATDVNGNLVSPSLPGSEKAALENAIQSLSRAVESFLAREYVPDVYVIPIKYAVAYDDGKLIIFHNVELSNA